VYLVDDIGECTQPVGQPLGQLEAQVEAMSSDVEQQITGGRDGGVPRSGELEELVQPSRPRAAVDPVPQTRPERLIPEASARTSATSASEPDRTVSTRKMADSVGWLRIGWGSVGGTVAPNLSDRA
jgi:hypothetical protein